MMRAALYARVSTEEQAKEGFSIDAQLNILSAWAVVKGYQVADRYIDDGYSAKNLNRPAVQRLLEDCRAGAIDAVVVWRLDRLSRSLRDTLTVVEDVFRAKNVEFISTTESIDTTTTSGRLMLNILASFAQNEREVNEERVRTVSMDLARQCVHMGGTPPYGFSVGADRHYLVNEAEAAAIRMLFQLRADGYGYGEIITRLTDAGYRTRSGSVFAKNALHDMLKNEKYAGVYTYNRAASASRDGKRNNHASKPNDEIIRIPGGMPAIVPQALFDVVQQRLTDDRLNAGAYHAKRVYIASGMVYCAVCGSKMTIENVGRNRDGSYQMSYRCRNKCVKRVRYEKLDEHIFNFFDELIADPAIIARAAEIAQENASHAQSDIAACAAAAASQLADIEAKIKNITAFIVSAGSAAPASLADELRALEAQRETCRYDASLIATKTKTADADEIHQRLAALANLRTADPDTQRVAIRRVVRAIRVGNDLIWIDLNAEPPDSTGTGGGEPSHSLTLSFETRR